MRLPSIEPLPKPDVRCGEYAGPPGEGASENYYTADQMREYALAYGNAVREECAKACEALPDASWPLTGIREECADAIRKD